MLATLGILLQEPRRKHHGASSKRGAGEEFLTDYVEMPREVCFVTGVAILKHLELFRGVSKNRLN